MALISLGSPVWWGDPLAGVAGFGAQSSQMSAAGSRVSFICQVPKTGTIDSIAFDISAVVDGTQTLGVRLVTIDANGDPTTSPYGGMTNGTLAATITTGVKEVSLGTSASATVGDIVVVDFYWTGTNGDISLRTQTGSTGDSIGFPLCRTYSGSVWSRVENRPMVSFGYSDTTYAVPYHCTPPGNPIQGLFTPDAAENPDEAGVRITVPAPMRVIGCLFELRNHGTNPAATFACRFYDTDDSTVLTTGTPGGAIDYDKMLDASLQDCCVFTFDSPQTLTKDDVHICSIITVTGTTDISISGLQLGSGNGKYREGYGLGLNGTTVSRQNEGTWSADDDDNVITFCLLFDQIDNGAGGGQTYLTTPNTNLRR